MKIFLLSLTLFGIPDALPDQVYTEAVLPTTASEREPMWECLTLEECKAEIHREVERARMERQDGALPNWACLTDEQCQGMAEIIANMNQARKEGEGATPLPPGWQCRTPEECQLERDAKSGGIGCGLTVKGALYCCCEGR